MKDLTSKGNLRDLIKRSVVVCGSHQVATEMFKKDVRFNKNNANNGKLDNTRELN